jgi:hypothetical protein
MGFIRAACCKITNQPGVGHVSGFASHLSGALKCGLCSQEFLVDYEPNSVPDCERKLRIKAQREINRDHAELHRRLFIDIASL